MERIWSINEVNVASGYENEKLLNEFEVVNVYTWGKDHQVNQDGR